MGETSYCFLSEVSVGIGTTSQGPCASSASDANVSDTRQIIYLDEPADDIDFVTLHNILYFIYIGCVNLPLLEEDQIEEPFPEGYPDEADPFRLYKNADKFLLPALKERCSMTSSMALRLKTSRKDCSTPNVSITRTSKNSISTISSQIMTQ